MSSPFASQKNSQINSKRSYRASFRDDWHRFIRSEFEGVAHVAHEFGCDPGTAENWWEGRNAPLGAFVGYAFNRWPAVALSYLTVKKA